MPHYSAEMFDLRSLLSGSVANREWGKISSSLVDAAKMLGEDDRLNVTDEVLDMIAHVLRTAWPVLCEEATTEVVAAVTECFRFLRNACAMRSNVQDNLESTSIFDSTFHLLNFFCDINNVDNNILLCIKVIIQFIGNAIVGNSVNLITAWTIIHPHLRQLLSNSDCSLVNCTCMVLFNMLLGKLEATLQYAIADMPLFLKCCSEGSEFAVFTVELILGKEGVLVEVYPKLKSEDRLKVLDAIWSLLVQEGNHEELDVKIPLPDMLFIVDQLKHHADCVLTIVEEGMSAEPREVLRLLDVVACASSRTQYLSAFQDDKSLLISIAYLLKNVTEIGRIEGGNVFSCVQRLSELERSRESVQEHPVFGFKAALVRLLGNLCYQHTDNQNQVRELGCVPVVLDTCNIDVNNPLLLQWGVLAVRNLLENNVANQQVIAGLVVQGPASATVLHELGMELHQDDSGSLYIAPFKRS